MPVVMHHKIRGTDLSDSQKDEALKLFEQGHGYNTIALKIGVRSKAVEKFILKLGKQRSYKEALEAKKNTK